MGPEFPLSCVAARLHERVTTAFKSFCVQMPALSSLAASCMPNQQAILHDLNMKWMWRRHGGLIGS